MKSDIDRRSSYTTVSSKFHAPADFTLNKTTRILFYKEFYYF
jgi:hypothetical protein